MKLSAIPRLNFFRIDNSPNLFLREGYLNEGTTNILVYRFDSITSEINEMGLDKETEVIPIKVNIQEQQLTIGDLNIGDCFKFVSASSTVICWVHASVNTPNTVKYCFMEDGHVSTFACGEDELVIKVDNANVVTG